MLPLLHQFSFWKIMFRQIICPDFGTARRFLFFAKKIW
jgi:hypothetical protein